LHDRLYEGLLANELHLDIPFVPHIGIANSLDPQTCKQIADKLNATSFEIKGRVEMLDLIWDKNNEVGTIDRINLRSNLI
jgi:2'-5' RNA ligase